MSNPTLPNEHDYHFDCEVANMRPANDTAVLNGTTSEPLQVHSNSDNLDQRTVVCSGNQLESPHTPTTALGYEVSSSGDGLSSMIKDGLSGRDSVFCAKEQEPSQGIVVHHAVNGDVDFVGDSSCSEIEADIAFEAKCRFIIQIGVAAYRYGSMGANVEGFLENAAKRMGFEQAVFRLSQSELFASVQESPEAWPKQYFVTIQDGIHLQKLGMVVEVAKRFLNRELRLDQAVDELDRIHDTADPFSAWSTFLSFMAVGGGLVMVLKGSWWDVVMGTILGGLNFVLITLFAMVPVHLQKWSDTCCAFCVSFVAALVKALYVPQLNVTMITLSAVAVQLPGYMVSLGLSELAGNRVIAGMAHFIRGLVTLFSLTLGAWLGVNFVERVVKQAEPLEMDSVPVDMIWQLLFIPLLFVSLGIAFQIAHRDFPWMMMNLTITYIVSFAMSRAASRDVGTFLSAVAFSIVANVWGRLKDRPNTIILLPSIVLSVSGSIGFQGVINLVNGDTYVGANQFLQMFIVAVMIFGGILVGSSLFPPHQTTL